MKQKTPDRDEALMQAFRLLREEPPDDLHDRILRTATALPQCQPAAPARACRWTWRRNRLAMPDLRMAWAFCFMALVVAGGLGVYVGQMQAVQATAMAQVDEAEMVVYSIMQGDAAWEDRI